MRILINFFRMVLNARNTFHCDLMKCVRMCLIWQGQKDLNPRHSVLETDALPTELYPYMKRTNNILTYGSKKVNSFFLKNIKVFSETQFFITK